MRPEPAVEETDTHIEVGDTPQPSVLDRLSMFADESRQEEIASQLRREKFASDIAAARWIIANDHHLLQDGRSQLDFKTRPFLVDIYKDACLDRVIYGSSQWGKTEWALCDIVAHASHGLQCMMVMPTGPKRDHFAKTRMDPCFETVPLYRHAIAEAKSRGYNTESVRQKGFGGGAITLVSANVPNDFVGTPVDVAWVDEHQACDQENIAMLDDRFSGSWYRGITRMGHPSIAGTEENPNLDWLYQNSDQRRWEVPCPTCKRFQFLEWEEHVVFVKYNKHGAITDLKPRDQEYKPGSRWDMRPVCKFCHRPMNRLTAHGHWKLTNPAHSRHGWQLSNLYNPNKPLSDMFVRFSGARYKPTAMAEFYNKQLGKTWGFAGDRIQEHLLQTCADGECGVIPYKFYAVSGLAWRRPVQEEAAAW